MIIFEMCVNEWNSNKEQEPKRVAPVVEWIYLVTFHHCSLEDWVESILPCYLVNSSRTLRKTPPGNTWILIRSKAKINRPFTFIMTGVNGRRSTYSEWISPWCICWDVCVEGFLQYAARLSPARSEAHDRLLSICAASDLLQQQVYSRHVYIETEPGGYRLITVNGWDNSQA